MNLGLAAKIVEGFAGSGLHRGAGFGNVGLELKESFAGDGLGLFGEADQLAVGGLGGGAVELLGGAGESIGKLFGELRLEFTNRFLREIASMSQIMASRRGLALDALDDLFGADAETFHLGIPTRAGFVETILKTRKEFIAGGMDDGAALQI